MTTKLHFVFLCLVLGSLSCKPKHGVTESSELDTTSDSCIPTQSSGGSSPASGNKFGEGVPSAQAIKNIGVTDDEIKAIHEYTSSTTSSSFIREVLQTTDPKDLDIYRGIFGKNYVEISNHFRSGITKISTKLPFRGTVWRGIVVYQKDIDVLRKFHAEKKPIGLSFDQTQAYTSSTRNKDFAMKWADNMLQEEKAKLNDKVRDKRLIYEIKQCKGAPIETIEPLGRGKEQMEVILPPAAFSIIDIKDYGSSTVGVLLQEIGCKSASLTDLTDETAFAVDGLSLADGQNDRQDPILSYFDFSVSAPDNDNSSSLTDLVPTPPPSIAPGFNLKSSDQVGFGLADNKVCPDPKLKEKLKKDFARMDEAANKVKKAQKAYNSATNAAEQNAARLALKAAQGEATNAAKGFGSAMKTVRVAKVASGALKLVPVVGYLAEGAALGMSIAEAVEIKKNGGSDSAAAAAVLAGYGIAGAIPAILACENCTPDEKAAAFFSGFFGIDFSSLVICPGKKCPQDQDLAGFNGDWSLNRVKRSCPKGIPLAGTSHGDVQINTICTSLHPLPVTDYRYVENGKWESRWSYDLKCDQNEYLAGISFLTSRGTPTYGIKSILCAKTSQGLGNSCTEVAAESCPSHQFLRGIFLDRAHRSKGNMGTLCSKAVGQGRDDDQFEYCDHVKSVWCCNIPPKI